MHYGDAIVGNFGGEGRIQYTALGDAMNTAARLEAANKMLETKVLLSREAMERTGLDWYRPMGRITLRGRSTPVEVFEPVPDWDEKDRAAVTAIIAAHEKGDSDSIQALGAVIKRCGEDLGLVNLLKRLKKTKMEKAMHLDKNAPVPSGRILPGFAKAALATFLLFGAGSVALAQNMVVRSTGPSASSYPAGKKMGNDAKITLKAQDKVTILTQSGTRVLSGPGTYSLAQGSSSTSTASTRLSSFINNRGSRRARTGAVRGDSSAAVVTPNNPNLWFLDVTKGGKFCVTNPKGLVVWRPDYTGSATASIVEPTSGNVTEIAWRKGNPLKAWPKDVLPVADGASYRLLGSNVPQSVEVSFVVLEKEPADLDETAAVLIEKGCSGQLDLLVETLNANNEDAADQG
nr:adenylate/guanylate cyclase domain-containing protein [Sphingopyxis sp. BSNA05]